MSRPLTATEGEVGAQIVMGDMGKFYGYTAKAILLGGGVVSVHAAPELQSTEATVLAAGTISYAVDASAKLLNLSKNTISANRLTLYTKLGTASMFQAIPEAFDRGILRVEEEVPLQASALSDSHRILIAGLASGVQNSRLQRQLELPNPHKLADAKQDLYDTLGVATATGAITMAYLTGLLLPAQETTA